MNLEYLPDLTNAVFALEYLQNYIKIIIHPFRWIFYQFFRKFVSYSWILLFVLFEISASSKLNPFTMKINYSCFYFILI